MIVKDKNQNDIMHSDLINSFEIDYIFDNKPINRFKNKPTIENTVSKLNILKEKIRNIKNCNLKDNAKQIVFNDGDFKSSLMIVGEGPGQKEDEIGKPFVGDAGQLLNKMLKAIKINRENLALNLMANLNIEPFTVFENIESILPGFAYEYSNNKILKIRWYKPKINKYKEDYT